MSCQQESRIITTTNCKVNQTSQKKNNNNCKSLNTCSHNIVKANKLTTGVIQQEDPYVFTESVPTTPPILFNTQKTRSRLNGIPPSMTGIVKLSQQKVPLTEANGKLSPNSNLVKTQASFLSAPKSADNTTCKKHQSFIATTAKTNTNCITKKLPNVCIVRPQLQTQQIHYQPFHPNCANASSVYTGDLKSISPPPLYTPPTPSLWQTPLLLETSNTTNTKIINVEAQRLSPTPTSQTIPIRSCVNPTVQAVGSASTTMNQSLTTTAMAKVAPIFVHSPIIPQHASSSPQSPIQCLPPSKFHNHTLAQHLHKVECLKDKKSGEVEKVLQNDNINSNNSPLKLSSTSTPSSKAHTKAPNKPANADNHSENEDLNEIPVNVIFRMAVVPQTSDKSSNNMQLVKPRNEVDIHPLQPQPESLPVQTQRQETPNHTAQFSSPTTTTLPLNTNVNKKLLLPASKTIVTKQLKKQQEIHMSSMPKQQQNATEMNSKITTTTVASDFLRHQAENESDGSSTKMPLKFHALSNVITNDPTIIAANVKRKNTTHISSKSGKQHSFSPKNFNMDCLFYNWQMGCSTAKGAVAIVKMSQDTANLDTSHLATSSVLPYCMQQCWFNSIDCNVSHGLLQRNNSFITQSLLREERIALYKQELHRQAIQLLATRSLQKLPLKVAKQRLLCVDRLLRKYQRKDRNKIELPANVKLCCINGCEAYTLEMAHHCQQHIVHNTAQHIFLPCTAKFADNTQCRVPIFDITHDLPLCMEHARKRDAYNRLLYEQRPRKISSNPIAINESIILTPKLSMGLNVNGVSVKGQNYLSKHQQQSGNSILQQLPTNNNTNSSKRLTLANQQGRKRKINLGLTSNSVGRPQKRVKKSVENSVGTLTAATITQHQMDSLTSPSLKRKNSATSLESIASNSQHSITSCTSHHQKPHQQIYGITSTIPDTLTSTLAPPALAPLSSSSVGHGLSQNLFSFGHDNQQQKFLPINNNEKHSSSPNNVSTTASTPTELKEYISQFSLISQNQTQGDTTVADVNLLNTNSNSNFTSSGVGSTTSLPTDIFSTCENSSTSSADTGLGGLSDPELMLGGPGGNITLGVDSHFMEGYDLENVINSLQEDAFKEFFYMVHQDESDEIERAIERADKHLKTLQQTTGSEFGDLLNFNSDILMQSENVCNGSSTNSILDTSNLFVEDGTIGSSSIVGGANDTQGGGTVVQTDARGLVQT